MIHRHTRTLKLTTGAMGGKLYMAAHNPDGSITVKTRQRKVTQMVIPKRKPSKMTPGKGALLPTSSPIMIDGNKE